MTKWPVRFFKVMIALLLFLFLGLSCDSSGWVNVVLTGSGTHLKGLEAAARSILQNTATPEAITIHIFQLENDIFEPVRMEMLQKWIERKGSTLALYNFTESDIGIYLNNRLTKKFDSTRLKAPSNYVRYILADALPQNTTKCMYMDTDIVALKDIVPLYNETLRLSTKILGAFPRESRNIWNETYRKLIDHGIDVAEPLPNFNAGLLIINLDLWRRQNISQKAAEVASLNNKLALWPHFGSQPPLIVLLGGSRFEKLNTSLFMNNAAYIKLADIAHEHIMFMHWNGKQKPWVPCAGWAPRQSCHNFDVWSIYSTP